MKKNLYGYLVVVLILVAFGWSGTSDLESQLQVPGYCVAGVDK
ncbi:hypothetical protein [Geopsychrobacter electrodiphilus]|nr:hypothetical protein [Geopsychrobacter electrodiphilus]